MVVSTKTAAVQHSPQDSGALGLYGTGNFINNSAERSGGAIRTFNYAVLNFNGTNNFQQTRVVVQPL